MAITQTFDLSVIPDSRPVVVHADQYDEGEGRFIINLYCHDTPYFPATGATAVIQGTNPDEGTFSHPVAISGNVVTADLTHQMTDVCGDVYTQIVVTEGEDRMGTSAFLIKVQKSVLEDSYGNYSEF